VASRRPRDGIRRRDERWVPVDGPRALALAAFRPYGWFQCAGNNRSGEFWGYPQSHAFAELLIDCEEDRTLKWYWSRCCVRPTSDRREYPPSGRPRVVALAERWRAAKPVVQ